MEFDKIIHKFYEELKDVTWKEIEVYCDSTRNKGRSIHAKCFYYYAEEQLYIFNFGPVIALQKGGCPKDALIKHLNKADNDYYVERKKW